MAEQEGGQEEVEAPAAQAVQAAKEVGSVVPGVEVASRVGHSRSNPTHSCHARCTQTVGWPALTSRAHAAVYDARRDHASLSNGARCGTCIHRTGRQDRRRRKIRRWLSCTR